MTTPHSKKKLFTFDGLSQPARFTDCDELIDGIRSILRGWRIREVQAEPSTRPAIRLAKTARGYRRVSRWMCRPSLSRGKIRKTTMSALCSFHFELIDWFIAENDNMLCLHCAAAQFNDGLVIFPTVVRSGKSTLSVHLAASGVRLFCDDVLPIEPSRNHGLALGILPRIRLPLPSRTSAFFRNFINNHQGLHNQHYLYVNLPRYLLAPLGEALPIRGIVLLERKSKTQPRLQVADKADTLSEVIQQNFARQLPGTHILDRLHQIVSNAECFTLRYSTGKQAVALLQDNFGSSSKANARLEQTGITGE